MNDGAVKLNRWKEVAGANSQVGFPAGRRLSIDASTWPTGAELAETLGSYHAALMEVWRVYQLVPEGQRQAAQPPPEIAGW